MLGSEFLGRHTVTVGGTISRTMVLENQKKNEAEYQCASPFTSWQDKWCDQLLPAPANMTSHHDELYPQIVPQNKPTPSLNHFC